MDLATKNFASLTGQLAALSLMVSQALAISAKQADPEDPRGLLRDILLAAEEELGETLAKVDVPQEPGVAEVMRGAAQRSTLHIASVADSLLQHSGAPPARGTL